MVVNRTALTPAPQPARRRPASRRSRSSSLRRLRFSEFLVASCVLVGPALPSRALAVLERSPGRRRNRMASASDSQCRDDGPSERVSQARDQAAERQDARHPAPAGFTNRNPSGGAPQDTNIGRGNACRQQATPRLLASSVAVGQRTGPVIGAGPGTEQIAELNEARAALQAK